MSDVKSKNLYELLGNDSDQDSDKEPAPPTKVIDKPVPRTGKRDASGTAPSEARGGAARGGRGGRRGDASGNDGAFRDREAGSVNNRGKPTDDGLRQDRHSNQIQGGRIQGNYDGRGGRGGRSGRGNRGNRDDRHTRGPQNDHTKQADQSWGAPTGNSEWDDEKAGEAIAKEEEKAEGAAGGWDSGIADLPGETPTDADGTAPAQGTTPADAPAGPIEEPEPEDNSRSYADYLAEQAEKKLKLGGGKLEARKPNEGSKQKKEWDNAKPISKDEEDEYMAGKEAKARREKQRKEKERVDVDLRYVDPNRGGGDRGGRGRGRGDKGDFRGRGRGRGDGFRGRGDGGFRGGRGKENHSPNVGDESAFPTLGGS
ncbi:hypothetical protein ACLMJK_008812 [Lecanora helva]